MSSFLQRCLGSKERPSTSDRESILPLPPSNPSSIQDGDGDDDSLEVSRSCTGRMVDAAKNYGREQVVEQLAQTVAHRKGNVAKTLVKEVATMGAALFASDNIKLFVHPFVHEGIPNQIPLGWSAAIPMGHAGLISGSRVGGAEAVECMYYGRPQALKTCTDALNCIGAYVYGLGVDYTGSTHWSSSLWEGMQETPIGKQLDGFLGLSLRNWISAWGVVSTYTAGYTGYVAVAGVNTLKESDVVDAVRQWILANTSGWSRTTVDMLMRTLSAATKIAEPTMLAWTFYSIFHYVTKCGALHKDDWDDYGHCGDMKHFTKLQDYEWIAATMGLLTVTALAFAALRSGLNTWRERQAYNRLQGTMVAGGTRSSGPKGCLPTLRDLAGGFDTLKVRELQDKVEILSRRAQKVAARIEAGHDDLLDSPLSLDGLLRADAQLARDFDALLGAFCDAHHLGNRDQLLKARVKGLIDQLGEAGVEDKALLRKLRKEITKTVRRTLPDASLLAFASNHSRQSAALDALLRFVDKDKNQRKLADENLGAAFNRQALADFWGALGAEIDARLLDAARTFAGPKSDDGEELSELVGDGDVQPLISEGPLLQALEAVSRSTVQTDDWAALLEQDPVAEARRTPTHSLSARFLTQAIQLFALTFGMAYLIYMLQTPSNALFSNMDYHPHNPC